MKQPNKKLSKKLPKQCEAASLLVGQVDFLTEPVTVFCRLEPPTTMTDLTEVLLPCRFMFVILSPLGGDVADKTIWESTEMARSLASLLTDKVCGYIELLFRLMAHPFMV